MGRSTKPSLVSPPVLPTSSLPPLLGLKDHSIALIKQSLQNLRTIYFFESASSPVVHPANLTVPRHSLKRIIHEELVADSGYASADEDEQAEETDEEVVFLTEEIDPDILRSDTFERAFAIKWLTGFIARSDIWLSLATDGADEDERSEILDDVTALLAKFAGDDLESTGALTRKFMFPTRHHRQPTSGAGHVEVELNDAALSNEDHTSVGLQSWGSSIVMAGRICLDPLEFGLGYGYDGSHVSDKSFRMLELGAGTGLLSIVCANLLQVRNLQIVATDYHPDVLTNLRQNIQTNFPSSPIAPITVQELDWERPDFSAPLDEPFDVILAADVIYHPEHANWIKGCVERLLVRPSGDQATKGGVFWLIVPIRLIGRHEGMCDTVAAVFPSAEKLGRGAGRVSYELAILSVEVVGRQDGIGRADESGYMIFRIGWV